jgi:ribosomal protein L7/L12
MEEHKSPSPPSLLSPDSAAEAKRGGDNDRRVSTTNSEGRSVVSVRYIAPLGQRKSVVSVGQKSPNRKGWTVSPQEARVSDVVLNSIEQGKATGVLKVLRAYTGIQNDEFSELLGNLPALVMGGMSVDGAEEFAQALRAAGAAAEAFAL